MPNKTYGYARVSSRDQNEIRQLISLEQFGVAKERIIVEKQSGKDFHRPQYQRLLARLRPGDTLVIKSIDRLGRNYAEIINQWRLITQERQVSIVVLDMPLLDTGQGRDLTGTLIADIVLQLLSYVAQSEREFNRQRQAEGIAAAKARGVRFGPAPKQLPEAFHGLCQLWRQGKISSRAAALELGVSYQTFLRRAKADLEPIP